jgi:hypothetical protein
MHHALASQNPFSQLSNRAAQGPLVPWELKCMREPHQCTAPECDCPPAQPTAPGPSDRFVLDEQAFLEAIEPPPLFLQPYRFGRTGRAS